MAINRFGSLFNLWLGASGSRLYIYVRACRQSQQSRRIVNGNGFVCFYVYIYIYTVKVEHPNIDTHRAHLYLGLRGTVPHNRWPSQVYSNDVPWGRKDTTIYIDQEIHNRWRKCGMNAIYTRWVKKNYVNNIYKFE